MARAPYNTAARKTLVSFLRNNRERQFSSSEIAEAVSDSGNLGKSTVYRQLSELCAEGIVRRYADGNRHPLYQYFSEGGCDSHFHMKCRLCGRLFHVDCPEMTQVADHVLAEHQFRIDRENTVLVGTCEDCGGTKNGEDR